MRTPGDSGELSLGRELECERLGWQLHLGGDLKEVFPGVVEEPGVLRNSANNPLYLLCFAVGNERGKKIALRIAEHLLKEVR